MKSASVRRGAIAVCAAALFAAIGLAACSVTTNSTPAATAAPVHFVNSRANAKSPNLAARYVDFSFDYPGNWQADPANGTATAANFVKVEHDDPDGATIENFAVGTYTATGDASADQAQIPALLATLESQVTSMPGYKRITIGEATTVAGLTGTQLTFSATPQINGKPGNAFGRVIIVPGPAGQNNGVVLIMIGSDVSGDLHSVADLGTKGQLPTILNSFKFGTPAAAPAPASGSSGASDNSAQ